MSKYNERQHSLMLSQLKRFEDSQIRLDTLVDDLEGLLNSLEDISNSWKQAFLHEWGKLEDERAYALFKNLQVLDHETSLRIRDALSKLKSLISEQVDDPIDRGQRSS